jgi:hypothetical protein
VWDVCNTCICEYMHVCVRVRCDDIDVYICAGDLVSEGRTDTVDRGGRDPVWTPPCKNVIHLPFRALRERCGFVLTLDAFDEDRFKAHDFIGNAELPMAPYITGEAYRGCGGRGRDVDVPLMNKKGKPKNGVLVINVRLTYAR